MELYKLAESCNYSDLKDEMIRDRLVVGIRDAVLSQQLQLDPEFTLEKAKKKIRVGEQQRELKGAAEGVTSLEEVRYRRQFRGKGPNSNKLGCDGKMKPTPAKTCTRCGKCWHACDRCPAKEATCHRCNKKGHYSTQCLTKQVSAV